MPEEGVPLTPNSNLLGTDEIIRLAKIFASQGVSKIRLTGGEPTLRKDLVSIVSRLREIDGINEVCMTSNGLALHRKLPDLSNAGLTGLNLSLDTLVPAKFEFFTRRAAAGLKNVRKSLDKALELGIPKVKLNTVVMRGQNEDEIKDFVEMTSRSALEVRFIEYMPFEGNKWNMKKMVTAEEMKRIIGLDLIPIKSEIGDTARAYSIKGYEGRVGFISSMSDHFCGTCTRLRLTSDGNLKVCLFGDEEVSLRDMMRNGLSDDELLNIIGVAVKGKKEKHAGLGELENMKNRPMILIGG